MDITVKSNRELELKFSSYDEFRQINKSMEGYYLSTFFKLHHLGVRTRKQIKWAHDICIQIAREANEYDFMGAVPAKVDYELTEVKRDDNTSYLALNWVSSSGNEYEIRFFGRRQNLLRYELTVKTVDDVEYSRIYKKAIEFCYEERNIGSTIRIYPYPVQIEEEELQIDNFDSAQEATEYLVRHAKDFNLQKGDEIDIAECDLHGTFYFSSQKHKCFCPKPHGEDRVWFAVVI